MPAARSVTNTPEDQGLKAAGRALVAAVGGVEDAELLCRVSKTLLSDYSHPNTGCFMPIDVVKDLEGSAHRTVGYPQVTRYLARKAGFALVALPESSAVSTGNLAGALSEASREHSDVATGLLDAMQGGEITADKARELMRECVESAEAAMRLRELLKQRAGEA